MPSCKNLKELATFINAKVKKAMDTKVAEDVVGLMKEHVQHDVYDAYQSSAKEKYPRTRGLQENIEVDRNSVQNGIVVKDTFYDEFTGNYVAEVVETGKGYTWKKSDMYKNPFPRPFIANTKKDLADGWFKYSLKEALKKEGLEIK